MRGGLYNNKIVLMSFMDDPLDKETSFDPSEYLP